MNADRNLLFGILTFQNNFIDRQALLTAFDHWTTDKKRELGEILVDLNALNESQRRLIEALVVEHLRKHGNDPEKSLAELAPASAVHKELKSLADADVEASLVRLSVENRVNGPGTTEAWSVGESSSAGTRFRVLRPHAKGGLGMVSVALDEELNREVAFKEIQDRYADDPISRSRFLLEAEVTGSLEHPGIVPVYGLGRHSDGRPFYAMRFIRGESLQAAIKRFHETDDSKRDPGERALGFRKLLGRFIDVCNAIEYAHCRGAPHRDLKPGNIMLGRYGETLVVDWGLAKPLGQSAKPSEPGEHTIRPTTANASAQTQLGSAIGTPQYMSPEQAEGRLDQLGPTSDVYCLGATLYCLLTGQAPFPDSDVLATVAQVCTGHFPLPRSVKKSVPPALQAICLKAMALKNDVRYPSARALADDVEHWLADEAVAAHREHFTERAIRRLRRHRGAAKAAAIALVSVSVISSVAATVVETVRRAEASARLMAQANEEKALAAQQAEASGAEAERKANDKAQRRLTQIEKGNEILGSIFADLEPGAEEKEGKSLQVLLGERLDRATKELEGDSVGDPLAVAKLQLTLGKSQLALSYPEKAIELLLRARATFVAEEGPDHLDTLASMNNLANAYQDAGKLDLAIPLFEETLRLDEATLATDHPQRLATMNNLAGAYLDAGRLDLALSLFEQTLKLRKSKLGAEHPDTLASINNLAVAYSGAGKRDLALPLFEEMFKVKKAKLGPEHPTTLTAMNNLALAYGNAGKFDLAIPLFEETLKLRTAKQGRDHRNTLGAMNNLAATFQALGQFDRALPLYEETVMLMKAKQGPEHPDTLTSINNLATLYWSLRKLDRSIPLFQETLEIQTRLLGKDHPATLLSLANLGVNWRDAGHLEESIPMLEEAYRKGGGHASLGWVADQLLATYMKAGSKDKATILLGEMLAKARDDLPPNSPQLADALAALGSSLLDLSSFAEAEPALRECLGIREKKEPNDWKTFSSQSMLGGSLTGQQKYAEAEPLLLAGYEGMKEREDKIPPQGKVRLTETLARIVELYVAVNQPEKADEWRTKLEAAQPKEPEARP